MTELRFGVSLIPTLDVGASRRLAVVAEQAGLEYIGVQDHPYAPQYLDAFVVIGDLLARTERIQVFPDVANLPLRPPAVLARTSSALSQVSGGRFQLGLGAGGYWDAIESMGAPPRTPPEALRALNEAITIMRGLWRADARVDHDGEFYRVRGIGGQEPGPGGVDIWIGAQGPRSLALTGRVADGWAAPIPTYLPYERWAESNEVLSRAAREAGRDPADVRRVAQLVGTIEAGAAAPRALAQSGADPVRADVAGWVELLIRLATEQPFTTFVLWPQRGDEQQIRLFAEEVVPGVRERMGGPVRRLTPPGVREYREEDTMRFGIFTLGDLPANPRRGARCLERIRNTVELAVKAEEVGLDVFASGESHSPRFVPSSPTTLRGCIVACTSACSSLPRAQAMAWLWGCYPTDTTTS